MASYTDDELLEDSPFTRLVGERLRRIRQQKQWSLSDVEDKSDSEFKASVLGAYERGERAISVPRLERLARFYGITIDQLLPFLCKIWYHMAQYYKAFIQHHQHKTKIEYH